MEQRFSDIKNPPLPLGNTRVPRISSHTLKCILTHAALSPAQQSKLLADEGLASDDLHGLDTRISFSSYLRILDQIATFKGDPKFGLSVSQLMGHDLLGAVGFLFLSSPTLEEAFFRFEKYVPAIQDVTKLTISKLDTGLAATYSLQDDKLFPRRHDAEFSIGVVYKLVSQYLARKFTPTFVKFEHKLAGSLSTYEKWFGCNVYFDQDVNEIAIGQSDLMTSSNLYDVNLIPILESYLRQDQNAGTSLKYIADQARSVISSSLAERRPVNADTIAELMGLSASRLHRRLKREGTNFRKLLLEKRMELACRLLLDTRASTLEIADRLGYSETGSFSRTFRNYMGVTPTAFRAADKYQ